MRHALVIAAAVGLLTGFSAPAYAQKLDANGRCHAANGQFAKADVCKGAAGPKMAGPKMAGPKMGAAAPAADAKGPYKLDAKGKCHDAKGKMAAKAKCAA